MGKLIDLEPRRLYQRELEHAVLDRDRKIDALQTQLNELQDGHRDRTYGLGLALISFIGGMMIGLLLAGL